MNFYYSNSNTVSPRGRFNSRGGSTYRGRGDSYRGGRGYSRGNYTPRGRGSYYPKYDGSSSSSKYVSDSKYSSHQRFDDSSYRKSDSSSFMSSREHTHHRSDLEMPRKRIRTDSYSPGQGSSSRRSHEEDYRGSSRYEPTSSYSDSRSFGDTRTMFKKPRIATGYKPKDDYRTGRKEMMRSNIGVSRIRTPRGRPYRGRGMSTRGDSYMARKRSSYTGSTSEVLAFRRAKLLKYKRMKQEEEEASLLKAEDSKSGDEEEDDMLSDEKDDLEKDDQDDDKGSSKADHLDDGDAEDGDIKKEKVKKEEVRTDYFGKPFMKLQCPQCSTKCITFKEYIQHLYQPLHVKAMRDKSVQLKTVLGKMRMAQRAKQKKADEEDLTSLSTRTIFCPICKLNYSQDKIEHQASEAHKKMRRFLLPYCKVCRISFKSPMLFETHVCSLDHIRRKHHREEREKKMASPGCLDNFMVLDSVGSGDEAEESKEEEMIEEKKEDIIKEKKDDLNLGVEYIRKVEVLYCELCRTYLPRLSDNQKVLRIHCATKHHLRCYLRFSSDELLERIKLSDGDKVKTEVKTEDAAADNKRTDGKRNSEETLLEDEAGIDDKLWADVGDLLSQVEPEVKSEDEDEEEGGRFDRFKSNEKKENGEVAPDKAGEAGAEAVAIKDEAKVDVAKADA